MSQGKETQNNTTGAVRLCGAVLLGSMMLSSGCLSGSNVIRDRSDDYTREQSYPPLKIPDHLDAVPAAPPPVAQTGVQQAPASGRRSHEDMLRPDVWILRNDGTIYRSSAGNNGEPELLVTNPAANFWDQLLEFWKTKRLAVVENKKESGIMVTDWLEQGTFIKRKQKIRLEVRQGRKPRELVLVIKSLFPRQTSLDDVKEQSRNTERQLLKEMLTFLAQYQDANAATAHSAGLKSLTKLEQDGNGNPILKVRAGFAETWRAVELALEKSGMPPLDKDRTAGLFFIQPDLVEGTTRDKAERKKSRANAPSKSKGTLSREGAHRIRVQRVGDASHVSVEKDVETLLTPAVSTRLLKQLQRHMD